MASAVPGARMPLLNPNCPWINADRVQAEFDRVYRKDRIGHWLHLGCAMLWCFVASWPISFIELGAIPLWLVFAGRQHNIWRMWGHALLQPMTIALAAFAAWQAVTLTWSPDPREGLHELSSLRWVWTLAILWPVIDRRNYLIAAFAAGFACGHATQIVQAVEQAIGVDWIDFGRAPDRISGWWNAVVGGLILCAALGVHLPAAVMGRGRARAWAIAGSTASIAGILATGTRGAWIAGGALVVVVLLVAAVRAGGRAPGWRAAAIGLGVLLLAGGALWFGVGDSISRRYDRARDEVRAALEKGDYSSDTGARIQMAIWAIDAVREHPLGGVGAGGYRAWVRARLDAKGVDPSSRPLHTHAHSTPLHLAATTGIVGLVLMAGFVLAALRGAFAGLSRESLGTYAAGPGFALVGLLLVSAFDPIYLTTPTCAQWFLLCGLCTLSRPRVLPPPGAASP